jgi:hypothetical protein
MITNLTSELNRINQGCKARIRYQDINLKCGEKVGDIGITFPVLCPTCQKEKETLKKVSLMWADFVLKRISIFSNVKTTTQKIMKIMNFKTELQQIKSLMDSQGESQDKINNGGQNGN